MRAKRITTRSIPGYLIAVFLMLCINSGCSVYMAAKQPDAKDLSVLNPGIHRSRVIAELGAPIWSGDKEGKKTDVFVFKHGYGAAARTGRAVFHATADVFTLGLWEIVSTPTEAYFSGTEIKVEVTYDDQEMVKATTDLTGQYPELNKPMIAEKKTDVIVENQPGLTETSDSSPNAAVTEPNRSFGGESQQHNVHRATSLSPETSQ